MATGSDHGFGGPAARRLETRYTAASLVTAGALVSALAFWSMLGRTVGDGVRAVQVEGPWYAVVCGVPFAATLAAVWLAQRGRLGWIVAPALVVVSAPLLVSVGSVLFDGPAPGHVDAARAAGVHLLAVPLLVGAAVTGGDATRGAVATMLAVLGSLGAMGMDPGDPAGAAWSAVLWVPFVALVAVGAHALARRRVGTAWGVTLAVVALPAVLAVVVTVVASGPALPDVVRGSAWFIPAVAVLLLGVWRETTDPLAGLSAIAPADLLEPRRRALRRVTPGVPVAAHAADPVPSGEAHR